MLSLTMSHFVIQANSHWTDTSGLANVTMSTGGTWQQRQANQIIGDVNLQVLALALYGDSSVMHVEFGMASILSKPS